MDTPSSLYKYMPLSDEKRKEYIRQIFQDHTVWFSNRADFNDPFEFHFTPSFEATTYEKIEVFARALQRKNPNLPNDSAKAEATSAILYTSQHPTVLEEWEQRRLSLFAKRLDEEVGIFCLTEHKDDILMWSHYADKHRGICIEFRPVNEEHNEFYHQAHKVIYPKDNSPPCLNFYHYRDNSGEWAVKCLTTKALHWEYEGEWRIIDVSNGPGKRSLPPGFISSMILGCRIESGHRDFVVELASSYPTPVTIYQARMRPGCYDLNIERCG